MCGLVKYEYSGKLGPVTMCHCTQCRKSSGTAFASNSSIDKKSFKIVSGNGLIKEFESSPGKFRAFCTECGSPVYSRRDSLPDKLRMRLGTADTAVGAEPSFHIFVSSKADWYTIKDDLPKYKLFEPGR